MKVCQGFIDGSIPCGLFKKFIGTIDKGCQYPLLKPFTAGIFRVLQPMDTGSRTPSKRGWSRFIRCTMTG
ncbi:hypothetical protein M5689_002012 [Euphorbia peplus]|nr:hypothetical protein M5689_002012 [Euphorbia peplus]